MDIVYRWNVQGTLAEFESFVRSRYGILRARLITVGATAAEADDTVQEALLAAWGKWASITHPELFNSPVLANSPRLDITDRSLMPPPPVPIRKVHRPFANRPAAAGRMLKKTVSAPVTMSGLMGGGMDVDMGGEGLPDGFDPAEWAKQEPNF